jgi:hypothetical protein
MELKINGAGANKRCPSLRCYVMLYCENLLLSDFIRFIENICLSILMSVNLTSLEQMLY